KAPVLAAWREVAGALEAVAFERHLPTVLAPQAVDERGRRAHDADAFDAVFEQPRGDRLSGLTRLPGGLSVVAVGPREHGQLRVRRKHACPASRTLGGVEGFEVAGLAAADRGVRGSA